MKNLLSYILPDESKRVVKKYKKVVEVINAKEESIKKMSQQEMRDIVNLYRKKLKEMGDKKEIDTKLSEILPDVFALVREAGRRTLGERHHDVQLIGGQVLFHRGIAEMRTGEGKTLVATLPTFLLSLAGRGVHVVTVNDYLAKRDAIWMGQVYNYLGASVGIIGRDTSFRYRETKSEAVDVEEHFTDSVTRREAYACDITYGTNSEFGFDYLRDNLAYREDETVQRDQYAALVDEADSILIDESRTPLIISSTAGEDDVVYRKFAEISAQMYKDIDFNIEEKEKQVTLTSKGIEKVEGLLGIDNIYNPGNAKLVHQLLNALRARAIFVKDKDYVVQNNEIIIVDEFTGRLKPGQRWSEGLHQSVEAKENVKIQKESKTVASITYQNYFRMYDRLAGMTGTAETSREEFQKVYDLSVIAIPTNKEIKRVDHNDVIYQTENAKWKAIVERVGTLHKKGQPVLIGTTSIEKNEKLAQYFDRANIPYKMLNAKNHEKEGEIIADAGKPGSIVIATNMAGRGVDIKLGGTEAKVAERESIRNLGGLYVIGTERHEARRIDNQLRGRSGRQGDNGETQFYVSLEDDVTRVFAGDRMKSWMEKFSVPEDMPIEHKMVNKIISDAQTKIEGHYFDMRKQILQYDAVLNTQRDSIYSKRKKVLHDDKLVIEDFVDKAIKIEGEIADLKSKILEKVSYEQYLLGTKQVILQSLDIHWMNHLDTMEHLRSSVSLRGYGQHDPLVEYKRDSLRLFKEMEYSIDKSIAQFLVNSMRESLKDGTSSNVDISNNTLNPVNLVDVVQGVDVGTVNRNDVCPCGSGKKYKKCHGKSE
jgi:preprotein translocase subunit SecA